MNNLLKHLRLVSEHRKYVRRVCFKMAIPWLGLIHDLSKYSLTELKICKYYSGKRSPHDEARAALGYSPSWSHHKRVNKHHWQYWLDDDVNGSFIGIKMPYKYVIESFADMVGAGKAYEKEKWTIQSPWNYWIKACKGKRIMNRESAYLLTKLLWNMHEAKSEEAFYKWYSNIETYLKKMYKNNELEY